MYSSQHSCGIRITYFEEKDVGRWTCITSMEGHKKKFRKSLWLGMAYERPETPIALTTTTTFSTTTTHSTTTTSSTTTALRTTRRTTRRGWGSMTTKRGWGSMTTKRGWWSMTTKKSWSTKKKCKPTSFLNTRLDCLFPGLFVVG